MNDVRGGNGATAAGRFRVAGGENAFAAGVRYGRIPGGRTHGEPASAPLPFATRTLITDEPLSMQMLHAGQFDDLEGIDARYGHAGDAPAASLTAGLNLADDSAGRDGPALLAALAAGVALLAGQRYRWRRGQVAAAAARRQACTPWADDDVDDAA